MKLSRIALGLAIAGLSLTANATNGYFSHGYGMSSKGMAGAGIAYPQDTLAAASNPAGMVFIGNRWDIGLDIFAPDRGFTWSFGSPDGNGDGMMESYFPIPEFGYNRMINDNMSLGVSVFGNGGMNTTYGDGDHPLTPPGATSGIDLMQMFVSPTIAYKVNSQLAVGASVNLIAQSFKAKGLQGFGVFDPSTGGNLDRDWSYGWGARVGAMYKVNDVVTLGATYASKGYMSDFDTYSMLFPDGGSFDIPANYGVGIAFKASDKLDVAFDVVRIEYEGVAVTGNKATLPLFGANQHGFGWEDQTVFKLGAAYKYSSDLTLRGGINYGKSPIDMPTAYVANDITSDLNTFAPGIVETHLTLGFTYNLSPNSSITGAYMHALNKKENGFGEFLGPVELEMSQNSFGLSYNKKL